MTRGNRARLAALTTALLTLPLLAGPPALAADRTPTVAEVATSDRSAGRTPSRLPGGGKTVFGKKRFLTAYYGTAGTGSLGVLGETDPDRAFSRIVRAGKPFLQRGERLLPVYELIVTVADGADFPGADGDHAHDVLHSRVQSYIDAARRNGVLLLLDLQPGRTDFLTPPSGGSGRSRTRGSAWRSTPSGGSGRASSRGRPSGRSPRARSTAPPAGSRG